MTGKIIKTTTFPMDGITTILAEDIDGCKYFWTETGIFAYQEQEEIDIPIHAGVVQEKQLCDGVEEFWQSRYLLPNGEWQGWAYYESFDEAHDTALFHAKDNPVEVMRVPDVKITEKLTIQKFNELLKSWGITKNNLSVQLGIDRSLFTKAEKSGSFSAPLNAALVLYFKL